MLNNFCGLPLRICPKNLKIRCTWRERLHIRWWWPFGSAKWRYESMLKENTFVITRDPLTNRKSIYTTEEGLRYLARENG